MNNIQPTDNTKCQKCQYLNIQMNLMPNAKSVRLIEYIIIIYRYCHLVINNICSNLVILLVIYTDKQTCIDIQKCGTTGTLALTPVRCNNHTDYIQKMTWHYAGTTGTMSKSFKS